LIKAVEVVRSGDGVAVEVIISNGLINICYILLDGELFEKGRWANQCRLSMPLADYRLTVKMAAAILREKREKAAQR